jgi:hypothetical protein
LDAQQTTPTERPEVRTTSAIGRNRRVFGAASFYVVLVTETHMLKVTSETIVKVFSYKDNEWTYRTKVLTTIYL